MSAPGQMPPLAWLTEPVTESAPAGPDLEIEGDDAFVDYYYEAEARLPERYFTPGMAGVAGSVDRLFDPKSVDLRAETAAITRLLERSRDLRLLTLLARFQILAGRLGDFADTLQGVAALIETQGAAVNPSAADAPSERRAALDALGAMRTVILPLQHLPLTGHLDTTYRRYLVATGMGEARANEEGVDRGNLVSQIASPANRAVVERTHADLGRAAEALARIAALSASEAGGGIRPATEDAQRTLIAMHDLIAEARPDLGRWQDRGAAAPAVDQPAPADEGAPAPIPAALPEPGVPADLPPIADTAAVRASLAAVERYLAMNEPSSPALLLVTQARLLVGRPLIEALETLLPADAARAVIGFSSETGFSLPMERLRALSQSVLGGFETQGDAATDAASVLPVESRAKAGAVMQAIEAFYARREPASPIPILLARARSFMGKGFQAIVAELVGKPSGEPKG